MTVENHYLSKNDLTPHQKAKIAELREKASKHLAKYPDYDTDFSLLRWLMGWDYDIGESIGHLSVFTAIISVKMSFYQSLPKRWTCCPL